MALRLIWMSVVLVSALALVSGTEEEMTLTLPKAGMSSVGKCVFPDTLPVHIFSPSRGRHWTIQLQRNNVITLSRSVTVMRSDNVLEQVPVDNNEQHRGVSGYHNHHDGAAFLVKCVPVGPYRSSFRLEGSIFVDNLKYRVDPTSNWLESLHTSSPTQETAIYAVAEVKEFRAQDSAAKVPLTEDYPWSTHTSQEHRVKRQTNTVLNYYIDVLPILDPNLFNIFYTQSGGNNTQAYRSVADYMSRMLTGVNMRTDTLVLGSRNLRFRLIDPLILTSTSQGPYSDADVETKNNSKSINATLLLTRFKTWLSKNTTLVYDHAMFLTALDIYGGGDNGIKFNVTTGLAFVGAMCMRNGMSSSVIEDKGAFQNEGVAAHELTHALGSYHDGENNTCQSSDRFLMSDGQYPATNASLLNPWKTSPCTSDYVLAHLIKMENDTMLRQCLVTSIGQEVSEVEVVSAEQQCKIFYGNSSFVCRGSNVPPLDTICDEFYCNIPGRDNVCGRLTAATGTCCGTQRKCIRGQCVSSLSGECPLDEVCPLGDQPGVITEGKNCSSLPLNYCYLNDIFLKCCRTCSQRMLTKPECRYGDKVLGCMSSECGSFFKNEPYKDVSYSSVCCSTCNNTCLDRQNVNYSGVVYSCSDLIFNQGVASICYQEQVRNSSCCKSCEEARDLKIPNCPWGDKRECSSYLKRNLTFRCNDTQRDNCCMTCSLLDTRFLANPTKLTSSSVVTTAAISKTSPTSTSQKPSSSTKASTVPSTPTTKPSSTVKIITAGSTSTSKPSSTVKLSTAGSTPTTKPSSTVKLSTAGSTSTIKPRNTTNFNTATSTPTTTERSAAEPSSRNNNNGITPQTTSSKNSSPDSNVFINICLYVFTVCCTILHVY